MKSAFPFLGASCRRVLGRTIILAAMTVGLAAGLAMLVSCAMGMYAGDLGLTTGGQQDIAAARAIIEDGRIPNPDWITVEGFLSEHTIPIEVPDEAGLLYTTATMAWNADFDVFTPMATMQIGFGTTIDPETFERDLLNLCLVIDVSKSMGDLIDSRSGTSKLDAVKISIDRLLANLSGNDLVSVVTFTDSAKRVVEAVPGDDLASIKGALDEMVAKGGTDLARGMSRGFRAVKDHTDGVRSDRIFVFTDALLTARYEDKAENFIDTMEDYAEDNIGATLFGVGVDFGHDIAYDISQVRGGNYFFLSDYDRMVSVFDEDFDYLVTPVAYDVTLQVSVPFEFDVAEVYGIPVEEPFPHELELAIPTLFLSSREGGGAVFVRLRAGAMVDFSEQNMTAEIVLSYTTPDSEEVTEAPVTAWLPGGFDPDATENYFETEGTKRGVLLLNTALVLRNACEDATDRWGDDYWDYAPGNYSQAADRLREFLNYFDPLAEGLENQVSPTSRSLSQERALVAQLLTNVGG